METVLNWDFAYTAEHFYQSVSQHEKNKGLFQKKMYSCPLSSYHVQIQQKKIDVLWRKVSQMLAVSLPQIL